MCRTGVDTCCYPSRVWRNLGRKHRGDIRARALTSGKNVQTDRFGSVVETICEVFTQILRAVRYPIFGWLQRNRYNRGIVVVIENRDSPDIRLNFSGGLIIRPVHRVIWIENTANTFDLADTVHHVCVKSHIRLVQVRLLVGYGNQVDWRTTSSVERL